MTTNRKENTVLISLKYTIVFIILFWVIGLLQIIGFEFYTYGILPRTKVGLIGIISSPLVHGNIHHLIANKIPFFILNFLLFLSHPQKASLYLFLIWITTGFLTWIVGRESWHIGASGIIYGLTSFLITNGILSKNLKLILISIIVFGLYYRFIWGIFPIERGVSGEGHLAGLISGIIWAFVYKKKIYN